MPRLVTVVCVCASLVWIVGCSKPSSRIQGKWQETTGKHRNGYEFFQDGTFHRYGNNKLSWKGTWRILKDGRLETNGNMQTDVYEMVFTGQTVTFKSPDGEVKVYRKVSNFASDDCAKELAAKGAQFWVAKEYEKAVPLLREAAEWEHPFAQNLIGCAYSWGLGVGRDYRLAIEWNKKAADQGFVWGQGNLAWLYATCKDPKYRDGVKALEYARRAVFQAPQGSKSLFIGTLSAAYARNAQFQDAIDQAQMAMSLAKTEKQRPPEEVKKQLAALTKMLESFEKHQPYIDTGEFD